MTFISEQETLELKPIQSSVEEAKEIKVINMEIKTQAWKVEMVKDLVLGYYSQTWDQVNVKCRDRELARSRHLLSYFFRIKLNLSLKEIGRMFKGKDHATIIHSIQTVKDWCDSDARFRKEFKAIERVIDFELKIN